MDESGVQLSSNGSGGTLFYREEGNTILSLACETRLVECGSDDRATLQGTSTISSLSIYRFWHYRYYPMFNEERNYRQIRRRQGNWQG